MASGLLAYQMMARHGGPIDRLRRDMLAEPTHENLLDFLAYDTASFVYAFLLATGNAVSPHDRRVRDDIQSAIVKVLAAHGITQDTFRVWPDIERPPASPV